MRQEYDKYTTADHEVWNILYERMMKILPAYSTKAYLNGIDIVGFESHRIPNFDEMNSKLGKISQWEVYAVPGLIENKGFFELLASKQFPASTWLRKREQLDYLEEPDMFHDVFGHVPLLANIPFSNFLVELAKIALIHIENPWAIELIARLYWYTVEFGLINENGKLKVYGAGILSSSGETVYSIDSDIPKRIPFDIKTIFETPYIKDKFQEQYFVIDSYEQLYNSIPEIDALLQKEILTSTH
jgi:phenylalanine-4-hydroxylase